MLNFNIQFYQFLLISLSLIIILIGVAFILKSLFNSVHLTLNFRAIYKKFKYYNFMKGKVILKSKYKTLRSVLLKEFTIKKILKLLTSIEYKKNKTKQTYTIYTPIKQANPPIGKTIFNVFKVLNLYLKHLTKELLPTFIIHSKLETYLVFLIYK